MYSSDFIHKSQKITFSANWICRGLPSVVVICEAVALGASENGLKSLGRPTEKMGARKPNMKVGWFRTLKNSARNCPDPASPRNFTFVSFTSEKSQSLDPGPRKMSRPAVPSWPIKLQGAAPGGHDSCLRRRA